MSLQILPCRNCERRRCKALQFSLVEPRPPDIRTIPSTKRKHGSIEYGDHLVRFLNGKTGLTAGQKGAWRQLVKELMEKVAGTRSSDDKIRGTGIKDVLKHFNSFEDKEVWNIDEGEAEDGLGVQLTIVWDGQLGEPVTQTVKPPKMPVKSKVVRVSSNRQMQTVEEEVTEEALMIEEREKIAVVRE